MSEKYLEPAKSVVAKFGVQKCAEITGKHISRIYRWMAPKEKGGTGGLIPLEDAALLLNYAEQSSIPLAHREFFPNREAAE